MDIETLKAGKHDAELAKMEAEVVAQLDSIEEEPVTQTVEEETTVEESANLEEKSPEEDEPKTEEPASEPVEEELTEEEKERLSDKTRKEMSKLREKARRADELESELENLKKKELAREPLKEVADVYAKEPEESYRLPWEPSLTPTQAKRIAREEVEKERKLTLISEDADFLESEFKELNPTSEDYDPDLASDIYTSFKTRFLSDDSTRLREIALKKINLISKVKERTRQEVEREKTIAKQTAEQAIPVEIVPAKPRSTITDAIKSVKTRAELEALESKIR